MARSSITIAIAMALICTPEMIFWAADMGWIGSTRWRHLSVSNGAFWPGLLQDWPPNYSAQPWVMFLTYSVLHISPWHMLSNALAVIWLGPRVIIHMGKTGFWLVWVMSAIVGALSFALLSIDTTPMVGASGSVFGLMGGVVTLSYLRSGRIGMACVITAGLISAHLLTLSAENVGLAWQTHLGGYISGALLAWWYRPHATARL